MRWQYQCGGGESAVDGDVQVESVSVEETWARLKSDAGSVLIDVRTGAELAFVGLPELSSLDKQPVLVEWQHFPGGQPNTAFVDRLAEALAAIGANKDKIGRASCRERVYG